MWLTCRSPVRSGWCDRRRIRGGVISTFSSNGPISLPPPSFLGERTSSEAVKRGCFPRRPPSVAAAYRQTSNDSAAWGRGAAAEQSAHKTTFVPVRLRRAFTLSRDDRRLAARKNNTKQTSPTSPRPVVLLLCDSFPEINRLFFFLFLNATNADSCHGVFFFIFFFLKLFICNRVLFCCY